MIDYSKLFSHLISCPMWHREAGVKKYKYFLVFVLELVGDHTGQPTKCQAVKVTYSS